MIAHGITLDSNRLAAFCRDWKIREVSVFGSILRDDFGPDSDIDFLVDYDDDAEWDLFDLFRMEEELERIVGRPVDVVDRYALECDGNRFVRAQIARTAELIYVR
jgi:hypothetical protein